MYNLLYLISDFSIDEISRSRFASFLALRALLGSVIESFVLLDRLMYLREQEHVVAEMLPIFDEGISPRNVILTATKNVL